MHGYDYSVEDQEAGFKNEFDKCMKRAADLYERFYADLPGEAQYVVPFAYKIRWYMKMNLREALTCVSPHHASRPSRLSFHLLGDVAQDFRKSIRHLAESGKLSTGGSTGWTVAVGDADGV